MYEIGHAAKLQILVYRGSEALWLLDKRQLQEEPFEIWNKRAIDANSNQRSTSLDMTGYVGSVVWMAPEVQKSNNVVYDQTVDVFSYAMVLFEIITGDIPWQKQKTLMKCLIM